MILSDLLQIDQTELSLPTDLTSAKRKEKKKIPVGWTEVKSRSRESDLISSLPPSNPTYWDRHIGKHNVKKKGLEDTVCHAILVYKVDWWATPLQYIQKVPQGLHLFVDSGLIWWAALLSVTRNVAAVKRGSNCSDASICAALN